MLILLDAGDIDEEGDPGEIIQSKDRDLRVQALPTETCVGLELRLQVQIRAQCISSSAGNALQFVWSPSLSHDLGSGVP